MRAPEIPVALEIRETQRTGRGVFATKIIPAGSWILEFEGQQCKSKDLPPDSLAMQIGDDLWLWSDGTLLDDCVNHSCDPNSGFAHNDPVLYALRDILPGEEVTWDYSTSIAEKGWGLDCLCGSKRCRGVILPFGDLSLDQQARLRPIALSYLRR
jgi:SET domain-containing protein